MLSCEGGGVLDYNKISLNEKRTRFVCMRHESNCLIIMQWVKYIYNYLRYNISL